MFERLGFLAVLTGSNFVATGHPVWGMCTLMVAGLLLRGSGVVGSLQLKAIDDIKKIGRR